MGNCLVTRLKAVVDNPNLPYFEAMQQFTLDAITASGNASMTDAQKTALNHFFYQIGAIDNADIFTKLDYLFLPMICGEVLAKAGINYKTNQTVVTFSPSAFAMREKGVYCTDNSATLPLIANNFINPTTNLCLCLFGTSSSKILNSGFRNGASSADSYNIVINDSSFKGLQIWENSSKRVNYVAPNKYFDGYIISLNGTTDNTKAFLGKNEVTLTKDTVGALSDYNYSHNLWCSLKGFNSETDAAVGAFMAGQALTADEVVKLNTAVADLRTAFV